MDHSQQPYRQMVDIQKQEGVYHFGIQGFAQQLRVQNLHQTVKTEVQQEFLQSLVY